MDVKMSHCFNLESDLLKSWVSSPPPHPHPSLCVEFSRCVRIWGKREQAGTGTLLEHGGFGERCSSCPAPVCVEQL